MNKSVTTRQLAVITTVGFTITKLHILPASLSHFSSEALWLSALINIIIDFLLLLAVLKITSNAKNENIILCFENKFGKTFTKILCFLYVLFFMLKTFIPIYEQKNSIELTFYETQPTFLTFMPFFIVAFYIVLKGVRPYARSMEISLWIFILGIAIIFLLSAFSGTYSSLLPVIPNNASFLNGSFKSLIWFGDPLLLLFFTGKIERSKNHNKKIIIAYIVYAVVTLAFLIVFYSIFDTIAERQYYASLKMSKYSISLSDIGRFDYLGAFLLSGINVFQVCLPLIFSSILLSYCFNFKNKIIPALIVTLIQVVFSLLTQNDFFKSLSFIQNYAVYFFILMTYLTPLIILLKRRKNGI
ncbi:MAG: GerAB/ArcD/ProY family transporter [Clostridia bacterium]|nr:GerAB/ArcD/ProY family transporter [Clostridia bacterium]